MEGGWDQNCVTDDMLKELLAVLQKNNISSKEQICAFLAECMFESDYGRGITEYGSDTYFAGKPYGKKYRGGGYLHITWEYSYQSFATYLILRNYPELQNYGTYLNPNSNSKENIASGYTKILQAAQELNIDISRYTRIVDEGADYVADNFAWESAGYYWETNRINEVIDNGGTIDDVSKLINKWDTGSFDQRKACYEKIVKSYEKANI